MTDTEKQVVDILVASGVAPSRDTGIRAVVSAMPKVLGSTDAAEKFINELAMRGLVRWQPIVSGKVEYDPKGQWEVPED